MDNLIPRTPTPMCLMPQAPVHRAVRGVHTAGSVPCRTIYRRHCTLQGVYIPGIVICKECIQQALCPAWSIYSRHYALQATYAAVTAS